MKINTTTHISVSKIGSVTNNYYLKRGFTMIELVFVIVILGILASIAVPKLVATKDDAGAVKAAQEMSNVITELVAFYTVKGQFESSSGQVIFYNADKALKAANDDVKRMSATLNEVLERTGGDKWTDCVDIKVGNTNAHITVAKIDTAKSNYCKAVVNVPAIAQWISQSTKKGTELDNELGIIVGGSSIFSAPAVIVAKP